MKLRIESALHEIIRDLPECWYSAYKYENGMITAADALQEIAEFVRADRIRQEVMESVKTYREMMKRTTPEQ